MYAVHSQLAGARKRFAQLAMSRPVVGRFPSLPWIPNYCGASAWHADLLTCESSQVAGLTSAGRLDITPMATVDWLRSSGAWTRLGPWGIAFRGQAGSVLFFSDRPIEHLDGADIAVCDETTTSVRVLEAILVGKYGLRIGNWRRNVDVKDDRTPRLLIQNQAVEERQRRRFSYVYDLGQEWWSWQGTPIVSAVWVHRAEIDPMLVALQRQRLEDAMATYRANPLLAVEKHLAREQLQHSASSICELHENFEYELGAESEAGITRMREVLKEKVTGFANAAAADAAMAI